jgi:hypothetical protein
MQIDALKKNNLLRRVALYLMLFIGTSYGLVRFLKMIPEDYLVVGVEDWLGFAGGLFGGFIAIYGIWITLDETRKQNAETLALQSIPLITFDVPAYFNEINGESISDIDDPEPSNISAKHYIRVPFSIDNKSSHIAKNFKFINATYKIFHMVSDIDEISSGRKSIEVDILSESNTQLDRISALPGGYSGKLFYMPEINLLKHDQLRFNFTLEYSDYLGKLTHSIECTTDILIDRKNIVENGNRKTTIKYKKKKKNRFLN